MHLTKLNDLDPLVSKYPKVFTHFTPCDHHLRSCDIAHHERPDGTLRLDTVSILVNDNDLATFTAPAPKPLVIKVDTAQEVLDWDMVFQIERVEQALPSTR